jgi:hypothetical protein
VISVLDWPRTVPVGQMATVLFALNATLPVTRVVIDLMGDGLAAPTTVQGVDLRPVVGLVFRPEARGTFELQLRATDACGREGVTGLKREVRVP